MFRTVLRCFALIVLVPLCPAQAPTATAPDFLGKWIVGDVLCSDCGNRTPEEKGTILEFTPTAITNPLSQNCKQDPDYGRLEQMSGTRAVSRYGKHWPHRLRHSVLQQGKVRYGFITCRGINYMQILFLSDQRAFYFFEGGIVFDLRRQDR